MTIDEILQWIDDHHDPKMKKIYTRPDQTIDVKGITMHDLRTLANRLGHDHSLAVQLYDLNIFETMMLATMICDPQQLSGEQLTQWAHRASQTTIIDQGLSNVLLHAFDCQTLLKHWMESDDVHLRYAGYASLATYLRLYPLDQMDIQLGHQALMTIHDTILNEPSTIQNAMNNAVVMAGLHVPALVDHAKRVADHIGYILPLKAKNSCNIQSASDYLKRYENEPKYSRVAKLNQKGIIS